MSGKRQKIQLGLAFGEETRSEAPKVPGGGSETLTGKRTIESPATGVPRPTGGYPAGLRPRGGRMNS
jgi:hypothetical protein